MAVVKRRHILSGLANCTGPLPPDIKRRLRCLIENPTNANWEDTYAILVRPTMTLWQAVTLVDPTFPTTGPGGPRGRRNPWPRVPDQLTLVRAIRYAKSGKMTSAQFRARVGLPPEAR